MPDNPINRRGFFRHGLRELLKPLANAMDPVERVIREFETLQPPRQIPRSGPRALPPHRPPGALPEPQLAQTCSRCGDCVRICPAQCIKIDPTGQTAAGLPYIDVDTMPCVLCDGLLCMPACPTGALVPTPLTEIHMGAAVWREDVCLRTAGEDCTICIDQCPVGAAALELCDGKVKVHEPHCTGCGVCQNRCPTTPKSIVVIPTSSAPIPRHHT